MAVVYRNNFPTLSLDDLRMEFRNFKLKSINNEIEFKISNSVVSENKDLLSFIADTFPDDIITGSLALKLFGLVTRDTNDIDILIKDKNRYDNYITDTYDDEFTTPNRLGYKRFEYKNGILKKKVIHNVDFFEDKNVPFLEFEVNVGGFISDIRKIKIHNPLEIMNYKLDIFANPRVGRMTGRKHNQDLTRIFMQAPWKSK